MLCSVRLDYLLGVIGVVIPPHVLGTASTHPLIHLYIIIILCDHPPLPPSKVNPLSNICELFHQSSVAALSLRDHGASENAVEGKLHSKTSSEIPTSKHAI